MSEVYELSDRFLLTPHNRPVRWTTTEDTVDKMVQRGWREVSYSEWRRAEIAWRQGQEGDAA